MTDRDRQPAERTQRILEQAKDTEIIPYDGAAFWARLRELLGARFSTCATDAGCIDWLTENCGSGKKNDESREADRKRFKRWSRGKRPRWENVYPLYPAINCRSPTDRPKLTIYDLVDGLLMHEATGDELQGDEPLDDEGSAGEPADERDLAALRAEAETLLGKSREITERLAKMGYTSPGVTGAKGVALKLVNVPARQVAKDLAKLARTTPKGPQQEHVQDLLWHLLPLVVNWVDVPARARDAVESGDAVELQLKTETVAEIALARDEGRRCFFAPVDKEPQGMSHIHLPASAHTVYFERDGQRLAQAVLNNLWEEGKPAKRRLANADFWQDIKKDSTSWESFVIRAKIEIEAGMDGHARFYLLLIDAKLDPQNNKDRETSWNVASGALNEAIPGLRIVRLKGGLAEEAVEYELVPHIRTVRDWK